MKMFSALKLKSFKCQSKSGEGDNDKSGDDDDDDDVSGHMYEKLPCKNHLNHIRPPSKTSFAKTIGKWRMECPGMGAVRGNESDTDSYEGQRDPGRRIPNFQCHESLRTKITSVNIEREDGNLGITLRGGFHQNSEISRPVIITYLKPDGPAAREGTIKPGDRLLAVDGISLQGSSLAEAQTLLRQPSATTLLTIEYDVSVLESVERANGPLLVEVERPSGQELGLTLLQNSNGILIERVKPGSLADRCGALHVGDEMLAVNATRVDEGSVTLEDVEKILEREGPILRLEILPTCAAFCYSNYGTWRPKDHALSFGTFSGHSTLKERKKKNELENGVDYKSNHITPHGLCGTEIALTHAETLHTTLSRESGSFGIQFIDAPDGSVLIHSIVPGGPAERSQCLHPGDRVLAVNHRSTALDNLTAADLNDLLEVKSTEVSGSKLSLHTEFDVLDTVVPASGVFTVKLVKKGSSGLGITLTASKCSGFIVSEMKRGSIAHRAGSLVPGDRVLAINSVPLDQCSVEYAAHVLHQSPSIVTLKIHREDMSSDLRKITYTVELQRYGGPLGITIAGSEEPFQPVTISGLTPGGLAEQTGVIHVGDEILAINEHSLYGEPLSKAHSLLQTSSDLVVLKISRSIAPACRLPNNRSPILPSSVDSAVESWDSSHLDLTPPPDHQKPVIDLKDSAKQNIKNLQDQTQTEDSMAATAVKSQPEVHAEDQTTSDLAILDEITSENLKIKQELDLLSLRLDEQRKSKLEEEGNLKEESFEKDSFAEKREPTAKGGSKEENEKVIIYGEVNRQQATKEPEDDNRCRESLLTNDFETFEMAYMPETRNWCKNQYLGEPGSVRSEFHCSRLYEVTLYKDPVYEDFGFSVSDGLYERGVFVNRIRKGGPADLTNVLKPFDRILQVNETFTQDFDCCLTVPLIASAGDTLVLLVARNSDGEGSTGNDMASNNRQDLTRILV